MPIPVADHAGFLAAGHVIQRRFAPGEAIDLTKGIIIRDLDNLIVDSGYELILRALISILVGSHLVK